MSALLAASKTPITDFIVGVGGVAGAGAVLGGIGGLLLALLSRPIRHIESIALGIFGFEVEWRRVLSSEEPEALDFAVTIAVVGAVGSVATLLLKVAEYYGLA